MSIGRGAGSCFRAACRPVGWIAVFLLSVALPAVGAETLFSLRGNAGVLNDENFFQNAVNVEERTMGSVGLELGVDQRRPRSTFVLRFVPSFSRELDDSRIHAERLRLEVGYNGELSPRTRWSASARGARSDNQDIIEVDPAETLILTRSTDYRFHQQRLGLERDVSARAGLEFGVEHSAGEYEAATLSDISVLGASVGTYLRRDETRIVRAVARTRRFEVSSGRDTDVHSLSVAVERPWGRKRGLVLELGGFEVRGPARIAGGGIGPQTSENGWHGRAVYRESARLLHYNVTLRREVAPGVGFGHATVAETVSLAVSTAGDRLVRFDFLGAFSRHEFLFGRDRATDNRLGTVRMHWRVAPEARLVLGYSRVRQDSDVPELDDLDFSRYSIGTTFPIFRSGPRTGPSPQ